MKDKIEAFLSALRAKLEKKGEKPALKRDLDDPEKFAEIISHSIGAETRKISFDTSTKE